MYINSGGQSVCLRRQQHHEKCGAGNRTAKLQFSGQTVLPLHCPQIVQNIITSVGKRTIVYCHQN